MEAAHPRKPIYMYINSHGGNVADGLAIYDTMQFVQPHIYTGTQLMQWRRAGTNCWAELPRICNGTWRGLPAVGVGKCMSMGAVLLAAGQPGKRLILPHTKVRPSAVGLRTPGPCPRLRQLRLEMRVSQARVLAAAGT